MKATTRIAGSVVRGVKGFDEVMSRVEGWLVCVILIEMVTLSFFQVILRNLFSMGFAWIDELLRVSVLWVGFIGSSLAIRQGRHINIDIMSRVLPEGSKPVLRFLLDAALGIVCLLYLIASIRFVDVQRQFGEMSDPLHTPVWVIQLVFPFLFGMGVLRCGIKLGDDLATITREAKR